MKAFLRTVFSTLFFTTMFVVPMTVLAQSGSVVDPPTTNSVVNPPTANSVVNPSIFTFQNPLKVDSICGLLMALLNVIMAIGIPIAVLFLVWSGALFVIARGDTKGLIKARANFFYTVLGIGLFLGAWFLGRVVAGTINAIQPGTISASNSCS